MWLMIWPNGSLLRENFVTPLRTFTFRRTPLRGMSGWGMSYKFCDVFAWITMHYFLLCLCNSVYIFWKSLPVNLNASNNPVFETCNLFVFIIFAMPVEGHRHSVAQHCNIATLQHCNSVYWPFFNNFHRSSSCYTQNVPPIICQPPTKLHGVTHHNTEYFLYRHTEYSSCTYRIQSLHPPVTPWQS